MGRREDQQKQEPLWIAHTELASAPGYPFYEKLSELLEAERFDFFVEGVCAKFYAEKFGRPSLLPGIYFRSLLIGYFEGIEAERGIAWRVADSLELRRFLGIALSEATPDHSTLSRTRRLIDLEAHEQVFAWVLSLLADRGLLQGKRIGIDATTLEANAAMKSIVRRDTRESYNEFLTGLAKASGIETPTREDLARLDRKRDKRTSNKEWMSPGITCVLLKYRVPGPEMYPKSAPDPRSGPYPKSPIALEDAKRTVGLVRFHAAEWHIDPRKIGVIGFSSGGHLVAAISTHFEHRLYPAVDAADKQSCRPDFAVAIYPGHLSLADNSIALNPDISTHITRQTPPTFLLQNEDDHVDRVEDSLSYYVGLKKAGVPVEMHLYAQGGHAFGLRRTKLPVTGWPQLVETWLATIGMISE